jgi:DNA primase
VRIPPEKIDEVRNAIDIVDYIGSFVKLKKRGKNYVGLCPFHTEKTPSFNVSAERQMYHCFGCGVGGNVFTYVMEYEKVSFTEAVRSLAEKAGITLPEYSPQQQAVESVQEQLYQVTRTAARFFYQNLTDTTEGKLALEYFRFRGFSDETIKSFGLGYAPNSWDALVKHAERENVGVQLLEQAGLAHKREDGTYYDYFRGRALFPIFSTTGRVIGFGARKMREDDPLGKYINSPETPIYNKSRSLYGLFQSKESIRENDFAILVEGYADLISVFQAGVKNIVASSGTALTEEQIRLIGRYTKNITIVYDADSAGSKAALRGVDLILQQGMDVRVAELPQGDDPDSFVRKNGGEAFRKLTAGAVSFIDFLALTFEHEGKLSTPEGQTETVRAIVQTIAKVGDELKRNFYIRHVAEKYKLYETMLHRELEKQLGEHFQNSQTRVTVAKTGTISGERTTIHQTTPPVGIPPEERDVIQAMLDGGPDITRFVFQHVGVDDFSMPETRWLVLQIMASHEEGLEIVPANLVNLVEDERQRRLITDLVFEKDQPTKRWDEGGVKVEKGSPLKRAFDAVKRFKWSEVQQLKRENNQALAEAARRGEDSSSYSERNKELVLQENEIRNWVFKEAPPANESV